MLEDAARALRLHTPKGDADALALSNDLLERDPMNGDAMFLAGTALHRMKQNGLSALILNAASQLRPEQAAVWNNLGCALQEWRPKDAVAVFSEALDREPDNIEARKNLAAVLGRIGRRDEAIALGKQLRKDMPDDLDVPYNLALDLLHTADWDAAFEAYQYSEGNEQRTVRNYHQDKETPRWDGTDTGETVVIYGEQGVGDEILASVAFQAAISNCPDTNFIIECDKRLESLFRRSFPDATVYGTRSRGALDWPLHEQPDASIIAMANFGYFTPAGVKAAPWLIPDPVLVAMFKDYLAKLGDGPKIGLSWSGGATDWDRAERTIDPNVLGPIMTTPNAVVVSLEYADGPSPEGIHEITWATRKGVDLDVTAALVAALDVVISVPQTVCDIAGAVGTPLIALVAENAPWRFAEAAGDAWVWENCKTYRRAPGSTSWMSTIVKVARDYRGL